MQKCDAKKKRSKLLVNCSAVIIGTEDFKLSSFLEKYKSTRFCIYKDMGQDLFIKIAFKDAKNTKESLTQDLVSNKEVLSFHFYKTWKEIEDAHGFETDSDLILFQEKKLKGRSRVFFKEISQIVAETIL